MRYKGFLKDRLFSIAKDILINLKYYLIIVALIFTISFVTGIFTAYKYAGDITAENFIHQSLLSFLKNDKSIFSLFLSYYFWFVIFSILVIFFTKNVFINIIEIVALMLCGYIIGFDLVVFVLSFGFVGIFFGIFIYGILMILNCALVVVILSIATKNMKEKISCNSIQDRRNLIMTYLCLLILSAIILFLFCILLSILHIFVIID